jgi:hypothetical protein
VRPDEHPAAEALDHFAIRSELQDRVSLRIAAFVAEAGLFLEAFAPDDRPDVASVGSTATLPTAPIGLPFGSCAQPSTMRYGFVGTCADAIGWIANAAPSMSPTTTTSA